MLPEIPAYAGPPTPGFVLGTTFLGTPDEFLNSLQEFQQSIYDSIEEGIEKFTEWVNGLTEGQALAYGGLIGGILGPLIPGGALAGPFAGAWMLWAVQKYAGSKLEEMAETWWGYYREFVDALWALVDSIFGDPGRLLTMSAWYLDGEESVAGAHAAAYQTKGNVATYWTGLGADAFATEADRQINAMDAMITKLPEAQSLVTSVAETIRSVWGDIISAVEGLVTAVTRTIAGAFDAGKLLLGEAGPILELVADGADFLSSILDSLRQMSTTARTSMLMDWTDLSNGDKSLPQGNWPEVDSLNERVSGDDGQWQDK